MAMKDLKSFTVAPEDEEKTVQLWMSFGWDLKSTQEVKTQDVQKFTGQDSDGTEHYQTTRGEHYIKLTFERDPERPNYKELVELEKQYNAPLPTVPAAPAFSKAKPVKMGCLWIILTIILTFTTLIGGVIVVIARLATFKKRVAKWEQQKAEFEKNSVSANAAYSDAVKAREEAKKKRAEALQKAKSLV